MTARVDAMHQFADQRHVERRVIVYQAGPSVDNRLERVSQIGTVTSLQYQDKGVAGIDVETLALSSQPSAAYVYLRIFQDSVFRRLSP